MLVTCHSISLIIGSFSARLTTIVRVRSSRASNCAPGKAIDVSHARKLVRGTAPRSTPPRLRRIYQPHITADNTERRDSHSPSLGYLWVPYMLEPFGDGRQNSRQL